MALLLTVSGVAMINMPVWGSDEAVHLIYAEQLSLGRVPNRDFFTVYGPGHFRLLQGLFALTGPTLAVERLVGVGYHAAIALGLMWLVEERGPLASRTAGIVCALVFLGFLPVAFPWLGGLALMVWSMALLKNSRGSSGAVVGGVLAGLVGFWRPEMLVLVVSTIPLLKRADQRGWYFAGFFIGVVPCAVHIISNLDGVLNDIVLGRLGVNAQSDLSQVDPVVWLLLTLTASGIVIAGSRARKDALAGCLALLGVLMTPQALQRIDIYHVTFVACVVLPGAAVLIVGKPWVLNRLGAVHSRLPAVGPVLALVVASTVVIQCVQILGITTTEVTNGHRRTAEWPEDAIRIQSVIASVHAHASPGQRLFIGARDMSRPGGGETILYHLLPEYSASGYYLEIASGASDRPGSRLAGDVASSDILVLNDVPEEAGRLALPNLLPGSLEANNVIRNGFCVVDVEGRTSVYTRGRCQADEGG